MLCVLQDGEMQYVKTSLSYVISGPFELQPTCRSYLALLYLSYSGLMLIHLTKFKRLQGSSYLARLSGADR